MPIVFKSKATKRGEVAEKVADELGIKRIDTELWTPRHTKKNKIYKIKKWLKGIRDDEGMHSVGVKIREICKRDLFYLTYEILGYRDLVEPLHDDMCDFIHAAEKEHAPTLMLVSRGHFKSTICTTGRCIQWMLRDQNTTIGLGSARLNGALKFIKEIREDQLERNELLQSLFPDVFYSDPNKQSPKWTQEKFTIKRTHERREPTVSAFGLEENIPTGPHFFHILLDDIVDAENVKTADRMEKVKTQRKYLRPLLVVPSDPIHYVGTPYDLHDAYSEVRKIPGIKQYIRPSGYTLGKPIFPERFNMKVLEQTREEMGSYIFSCQYEMQPLDPSDRMFKREWLKWRPRRTPEHKKRGHNFYLIVDPASTQRKTSDFTFMGVLSYDWEGQMDFADGVHDKLTSLQRINKVFELVEKWGIDIVGYECIGFQQTDSDYLRREMTVRNKYFQIIEIRKHKTTKEARIEGFTPIVESGKFFLPTGGIPYRRLWEQPDDGKGQDIDICENFLYEYDHFKPGGQLTHDDIIDGMAMARDLLVKGSIPKPKRPVETGAYKYGDRRKKTRSPLAG